MDARTADKLVDLAKKARRDGDGREAARLYGLAASEYEAAGDLMKGAHAARHEAELLLDSGESGEAQTIICAVVLFYGTCDVAPLELANALRVSAMCHEREGFLENAREHWALARGLYVAEGVDVGVAEADRRLLRWGEVAVGAVS